MVRNRTTPKVLPRRMKPVDLFLGRQKDIARERHNRFSILNEENMEIAVDPSGQNQSQQVSEKSPKMPPIIIDSSFDFKKVIEFVGSDHYQFKRTSIGTKVFSQSTEKYDELKKRLEANKYLYHTHKLRANDVFKMVLIGLHKVDVESIREELEVSHGIKCEEVKEIITKKSSDSDALYLLTFKRNEVRKKTLHNIKYILRVAVTWTNQSVRPNRGPTQCSKCGMFGHGSENCFRTKVCFLCSNSGHDVSSCKLNQKDPQGIQYKCFNCVSKSYPNADHRADDPRCRCRKEYLEVRRNVTTKNTLSQKKSTYASFEYDESKFPSTSQNFCHEAPGPSNQPSYANKLKESPNDELLTLEQLFAIFQKAAVALKKCSTKFDQLYVLLEMLQYV